MRTYHTFLIVFAVSIISFGGYTYFSNGINAQAAGSLLSQSGTSPLEAVTGSDDAKISVDTAFLTTLASLTKIKIDTSLFTNTAFQKLNDNTVVLETVALGRANPFAPVATLVNDTEAVVSPVVTNEPVKITAKTAVLSGTVTSETGVTNTYFEYGPTPSLGKVTPQAAPSLIGTFIMTINGLEPETAYFYRAVAKIGGAPLYGEVVSFETTN